MMSGTKITSLIATLAAGVGAFSASAFAVNIGVIGDTPVGAPEIDGPAGIGALAMLVSAGILAYRRFSK
jgi:hypothetical protein